ncbi:MAG: DNA polymerase I [Bacillota bacterium]|nr:DNA polymerase I [Bacillota bacterium]
MLKLMAIDGNSLMHRAFYAIGNLTNSKGVPTNAVYGFLRMLIRVLKDERPDYLLVAFDMKGPTFRHAQYVEYKAGRKETPPDLHTQYPLLKQALSKMKIRICEAQGFEADDILGTVSLMAEDAGMEVLLVTGDRDTLQLVSPKTKVMLTKRGITDTVIYDEPSLVAEYGILPAQMIDVKGLMGDASDNIPGVPGVGEKTALKLVQQYGTLEKVLEIADDIQGEKLKQTLKQNAGLARMSRMLATIIRDVPLPQGLEAMKFIYPSKEDAVAALEELEFKSLMKEFDAAPAPDLPGAKPKALGVKIVEISSMASLKSAAAGLARSETAAFYFDNDRVSFATGEESQYDVHIEQNLLCEGLSWNDALSELKPVLENPGIKKIFHDAKRARALLHREGVETGGIWFDTMIGAYLLDSTGGKYSLEPVMKNYLGQDCAKAAGLVSLQKIMGKMLEETGMSKLFYDVEMKLMDVLYDMEREGFHIDLDVLAAIDREYSARISTLAGDIQALAGTEFNINSPKQLGDVLYDKLGLSKGKKTKTGFSTDIEVLGKLCGEHPIIEKIMEYRQLAKLKSTYIDGLRLQTDKKTGKVHTTFNQTVTATGRISSTEPNLQNIPVRTELGKEIRRAFLASAADRVLVAADYSQIELRILAHISEDPVMIDAFLHEQDIHTRTAAEVFDVPLDKVKSHMRSSAKAVNFGIVYGISDFGLARNLSISRKKAAEYIEKYFQKYARVKKYMEEIVQKTKETGYVTTLLGRRRYVPELRSQNYSIRSFGERVALNTPIQGTAADIIKLAMIRVHDVLKMRKMRSSLILQVHDELVVDAAIKEADEVKKILKENMENVMQLRVPLVAQVSWGKSWYDTK